MGRRSGQWPFAGGLEEIDTAEGCAQPVGPLRRLMHPRRLDTGLFMLLGCWAWRDVVVSGDVNILRTGI